jgi:Rhodopirellula transposase DDE domain
METDTFELNDCLKSLLKATAEKLKGSDRRQFIAQVVKGLGVGGQTQAERELGWNRGTIRKGMQELSSGMMNYRLRRVVKTKPQKKIPETETIFERVKQINQEADEDENTLRISIDAKTTVKVGDYDRGGKKSSANSSSRP